MPDTTTTPPAPAPTAHDHQKLWLLLQILAHIAPAIAAPFVKNPQSVTILNTEGNLAGQIVDVLSQSAASGQ